jgi:D-serine deaminase-like pyridoxal phosphate-dependent protein
LAQEGEVAVELDVRTRRSACRSNRIGAKVGAARKLAANQGLCFQGMNLVGKGFRLTPEEVLTPG